MSRLKSYFKLVFNKFGIVVPVISISVLFVISIVFDINNIISLFIKKSADAFIVLVAIFAVIFLGTLIMTLVKIKSKTIVLYDLFNIIVMGISFLMIALFLCLPAKGWLSVVKYVTTITIFILAILIAFLRSKFVELEEDQKDVK